MTPRVVAALLSLGAAPCDGGPAELRLWSALSSIEVGIATEFDRPERDRWNPSPWAACLHRDLDAARDVIVAHRTLPCGTIILICVVRTGACVRARIGDRGPRRALVDLAPATVRVLGRRSWGGRELVLLLPLGAAPLSPSTFSGEVRR